MRNYIPTRKLENKKSFFLNSKSIYNSTFQPVCMYSTTLTHVALKKSSGHKGRHIFKFHIFHTRHRTKKRYPFFHKILSLLTEQDEFDIVLANPGCHTRFQFYVQKVPLSSSYMHSCNPVLHAYIGTGVRMF